MWARTNLNKIFKRLFKFLSKTHDQKPKSLLILRMALWVNQLRTIIRKLVFPLVMFHLPAPALHTLCFCLQKLEEPAAVTLTHRAAHNLQGVFRYAVNPRIGRGQDGGVESNVLVVVWCAGMVVVPWALDADGGGGGITRVLPWHAARGREICDRRVSWCVVWSVQIGLYCCRHAVRTCEPTVTEI